MLLHIQQGFNMKEDEFLWSPEPLLQDVAGSLVARSAQCQTTDGCQALTSQQRAKVGELRSYVYTKFGQNLRGRDFDVLSSFDP